MRKGSGIMGCRKEKKNCECQKDCLCRILRKFKNRQITINTKSGDIISGELVKVTNDCCVKILEPQMITPFINERLTVIRCKDIESFTVELFGP